MLKSELLGYIYLAYYCFSYYASLAGKVFKFKILSYNVLAQYLLECHPYLYTDCAPYNLKWNARAAKLFDEIIKLAPDVSLYKNHYQYYTIIYIKPTGKVILVKDFA